MKQTVQGLSMGSVLITSWIAIALSGVMLLQAYTYYRGRPQNDHRIFGLMVVVLLLLDMAHVVCIMATLYHYLIRNFGNNNALAFLVPSLSLTVGLTGTITFFAQSFFTWRVWKLSRKNFIAPVIFVLQIARLTCGWVTTAKAIEFGTFTAWAHQVRSSALVSDSGQWIFTGGLAIAVVCDILITGSLCYWLHGSRTGLHGMDEIIDKIILYSVENGALTCISSIASLICAVIMPGNLVFIGIHFVISKLYINSVLASLNTRNTFRAQKEWQGRKTRREMFINSPSYVEDGSEPTREQNAYALQSPKLPARGYSSRLSGSGPSVKSASTPTTIEFVIKTEHVPSIDETFVDKVNHSE